MAIPDKPGWWNVSLSPETHSTWRLFEWNGRGEMCFWSQTVDGSLVFSKHYPSHSHYKYSPFCPTISVEPDYLKALEKEKGKLFNLKTTETQQEEKQVPLFSLLGKF